MIKHCFHIFIFDNTLLICCSNAMSLCSEDVMKKMDLTAWSTSSPHFVVSGSLLAESVARAKRDVHKIMQQEMDLWEQRE